MRAGDRFAWPAEPLWYWSLDHPSGWCFSITGRVASIVVGRRDRVSGWTPDVDISAIDPIRSASRRHATIGFVGAICLVTELSGVMNGTYINGVRIPEREIRVLQSGDALKLGGVEMLVNRLRMA